MGGKYKKYKNSIERFLSSSKGARFFHIMYSVGAAIVIIGALFKINNYPMGSFILAVGMVVEAIIFALSAFDKPQKDYNWEEVFPVLQKEQEEADNDDDDDENDNEKTAVLEEAMSASSGPRIMYSTPVGGGGSVSAGSASGVVVVGSGIGGTGSLGAGSAGSASGVVVVGSGTGGTGSLGTGSAIEASEGYSEQLASLSESMSRFAEVTNNLANVSGKLLESFESINENSEGIGNNTKGYIQQMEALNRNVSGLNTIYEIQLKGVSGQINTIEEINAGLARIKNLYAGSLADSSVFKAETEKMAMQLAELNRVYGRLLQAMTTNMNMGMGGNFPNNPPQDEVK